MSFIVQAQGISKTFAAPAGGRLHALREVSLQARAGQLTALVGPDGAGKTTLMRLLAALLAPDAGRLAVLGHELGQGGARQPQAVQSRISYMPQRFGLYEDLSVQENLDLYADLHGVPPAVRGARYARLLEMTGLARFTGRPAGKLSGGMKQKLGLCCALVHDPELLILDEPTTGVDPLSRQQFWALVEGLRRERPGMTVIVSTAYMDEAGRFERLVAMDAGRVLAQGSPASLMERTGAASLEEAYIALLPPAKRPAGGALSIAPWRDTGGAPAIEASGLTRRFGGFTAVASTSFEVARGEIFGLLGPNGAGKTTSFYMIVGLLRADAGSITIDGRAIEKMPIHQRSRLGLSYLPQEASIFRRLTVAENVRAVLELQRGPDGRPLPAPEIERRLDELLKQLSVSELRDTPAPALSGGERRRVEIARALATQPRFILLDEPFAGIDPIAVIEIQRIVTFLKEQGIGVLITDHSVRETLGICDHAVIISEGRVLAAGTPAEIVANPDVRRIYLGEHFHL